jgi:iron(III) transport system ATP-binding protein
MAATALSANIDARPATAALTATGLSKAFGPRRAVDAVDLEVRDGELFALLGPSGCGKSTLLRLIAGFEVPDTGTVDVAGRAVAGRDAWVEPERRGIGLVPQGDTLFPHLTVADNVAFGVGRDRDRAVHALELVGLAHRSRCQPHELSGGERQRVALARALAPGPALILLDEPFAALDAGLRSRLRRDVVEILRAAGATGVLVTHDQEEALGLADRVAIMRDGRIVQCGEPPDLYWRPVDAWAAAFLGEINLLHADLRDGVAWTPIGAFASTRGDGAVRVGVRPEQLLLREDAGGDAVVAEREFRGHDVMYRLHHAGLGSLAVQLPSVELFTPGQRVRVFPHERAVAAVLEG